MKLTDLIFPSNSTRRKWNSIGLTVFVAGLFTWWMTNKIEEYGIALFILIPLFLGACPVILYNYKGQVSVKRALHIGWLSLGIFTACLLLFAMEGLICIAMAAPIGILFTTIGSLLAYALIYKKPDSASATILLFIIAIPGVAFIDKEIEPYVTSVVTSIEIDADPGTVWENVVEFPQLDEPTEFIFKTGIAYPINARIEGSGAEAVRYCNFTTGSFVEPITVWDEPRLLKFDVVQQPVPMKELSFWDIDAPHLHDYFVSKQGQFKLTALPNGKTRLEGTTWYSHDIKPAWYWSIWSRHIIHKIHERVLKHIKRNAESK